jgi:pyochelin biosynthetic protein PchC
MNALRLWSRADEARMWLLCLPPGGGGARLFKSWADGLPKGLGVAALELPGRGGRRDEPFCSDVGELVGQLARDIAPLLERPVMLFGHSMGAILAFDLARLLRTERGWRPMALIAAASEAPDQRLVPASAAASDEQLVQWLRRWGGTSEALLASPEFLAEVLPVLRADLALMEARVHRDQAPLDCPIRVYLGALDPTVNGPSAEQGWARHTTAERPARTFPGGHFFVQESAELVLAALAEDANTAVGGQLLRSQ